MTDTTTFDRGFDTRSWITEKIFMGMSFGDYLKSLLTPTNAIFALILIVGVPIVIYRFAFGLGAVTNLTEVNPWGIWIGIDVMSGVALAAGGFTVATAVHVLGLKEYQPIVRPALLTGFLGYLFAVIGLCADLGRPWKLPVPMVYSYGTGSVMFEVGWCVCLYLIVLGLEFSPAAFEWLGLRKAREWAIRMTLVLTIFGLCLSTLHQSSLGAFFLMTPGKLHPLWYSPFLPVFFFVSSLAAGIGMVVVESALSHRAFRDRLDPAASVDLDRITLSLAKGGAIVLFAYFFIRLQGLVASGRFDLLATGWGAWYLFEMLGFILLPSFVFAFAARRKSARLARIAGVLTVLGVILNRFNVSLIAFNWNVPDRYVPSAGEVITSLTIVTIGVLIFRWIVNRMPVVNEHPDWRGAH